jgi:hypothetical protein
MGKTRKPLDILITYGVPNNLVTYLTDKGHNVTVDSLDDDYPLLECFDLILGKNCHNYNAVYESEYGLTLLDQLIKDIQKDV